LTDYETESENTFASEETRRTLLEENRIEIWPEKANFKPVEFEGFKRNWT
jgi:hypothetical protein